MVHHEYGFDITDRETGETRTFEGSYEMRFWAADELRELLSGAGFAEVRVDASEGCLDATALPT